MRATRSRRRVLSFFMGVLFGILLLAGGIVGGAFWAYSSLKLKTIQGWIGMDIVKGDDPEKLADKSIRDLIAWGGAYFADSSNLTINNINKTFGDYIPTSINLGNGATFSLAAIADTPLFEIPQNINLLLDGVTVATIRSLVTLPDIPILTKLDGSLPITQIFDTLSSSITGDEVSLGSLGEDFGIALPDHPVLNKFKTVPISQLENQVTDIIMEMTLIEILGEEQCASGPLAALKDFPVGQLGDKVPTLPLSAFIDIGDNPILQAFDNIPLSELSTQASDVVMGLTILEVLGEEQCASGVLASIKDFKIGELGDQVPTLTLSAFIDISDSPLLQALDIPINQLGTDAADIITGLPLVEILGEDKCSSGLLLAIKDYNIGELDQKVPTLPLSSFVDVGTSGILFALKDSSINSLETDIKTIELGVFIDITPDSPKILQSLQNTKLSDLSASFDNLSMADIWTASGNDTIIDKLILAKDENGNPYKLTEIDRAMDTIIKDCTVRELASFAGKAIDGQILDPRPTSPTFGTDLYELPLPDFIDAISAVMAYYQALIGNLP